MTQDSCNFTAAHINEVVEDSVASFQKQTSLSEAAMSTQLATYGLQGPQRLHQPKTEHTVDKPVQRWTFELIKVACCQGVMDFRVAANLYLEVEEGIVGEDQARTTVRHAVRGLERAEKLLDVVDKRYVVEAEQAAEQATSTLSSVSQTIIPTMQRQRASSDMLAREMRSWVSSPSPSTRQGRAGPCSNSR